MPLLLESNVLNDSDQTPAPSDIPAAEPPGKLTARSIVLGLALGLSVTLAIGLVAAVWLLRDPMPRVSAESLEAAIRRWDEAGPGSYRLQVELSGSQQGAIHIEVHDEQVVAMTRDGVAPSQRRTWDYWSVPSQLEMIAQDLDSAEDPEAAFGVSSRSQVVMKADFDPRFGYPRVYQRAILGTGSELRWEITSFEVLP